jgi:uncharacterized lipoprotein YddW (UPF0748 family)
MRQISLNYSVVLPVIIFLTVFHFQSLFAEEILWKTSNAPLKTGQKDQEGVLRETRVLFDEDIHWAYSSLEADRILERVKAAGFNVYIPCVWHGRGTHFPTMVTKPDAQLSKLLLSGYDPLKYLIKKAHQLGIEVHPWFTVARREWPRHPEFFNNGTPDNAYDVHNPYFREFIINLMMDVVQRYDVDGINLDYIRSMGVCTSVECKKDYQKFSGYNLSSDLFARYVAGKSRERIVAWQDSAIEDIVGRFSQEARKIKPRLIISVDGDPLPRNELPSIEGRDEVHWVEKGWIDIIFNMDYRMQIDYETIDKVRAELHDPGRIYPLYGNFDLIDGNPVSRSGEIIERFIEFSRLKWPDSGFAFYIFQMMNDDQVEALKNGVFSETAKPLWPEVHVWSDPHCGLKKECGATVQDVGSKGP